MKLISLEIGSSAVKAGLTEYDERTPGSPLSLLQVATVPLENSVRYGRILNVEDVTAATAMALARLSDNPALKNGKITGVYVSVGGRSLASLRDQESLRIPEERLITEDLIDRLDCEALAKVPKDKEPLEIVPLGYRVNGLRADRPIGSYGTALSADFTVIYADKLNSRNIERVVNQRLSCDILGYLVRPIVIADAVLTADDRNAGCILVDMGAETTTCSIYASGVLQYVATIPMGGRNITHDLALGLGVTEQRAEQIKISVGKAINENGTAPAEEVQVDNIVQARAYEILQNVIAQIGFAGYTEADMRGGIIVTGGGSRLYGLNHLLNVLSGLNVRVATLPPTVHICDPADNTSANIDIIALSLAARRYAENDAEGCPCVSYPVAEEKPAEEEKSAEDKETIEEKVELEYEDEDEDTPDTYYGPHKKVEVTYDDDEEEDVPVNEKSYNDDEVLLNDDEIEARRAKERRRLADERLREAHKKDKEQKAAEKTRKWGRFINRIGSALSGGGNDDGEGNDI
ncbi:MAG: cell division FtsA domain-containing protein [Muribaculaceae bacterium]